MKQNEVSAYDFACGAVQQTEINDCWIELYREHNCYHIRMGRNGEKWSRWETFDSAYESPLKQARTTWSYFKTLAKLGRVYPVKCNQCSPSRINGIFCHEKGCPNDYKTFDQYEGEWIEENTDEEN